MPEKHWFGPSSEKSKGKGHPILFSFSQSEDFGVFPDGGGYPLRFLEKAYRLLGVNNPNKVLHLCSGSVNRGVTVDIRKSTYPTIVADVRYLPIKSESFEWILADPPYSVEYARNLYGTESVYPKPLEIIKEATRVLKRGGKLGFLHFQVPFFRKPLKLLNTYGITTGLGYNIRAFSVFEKGF